MEDYHDIYVIGLDMENRAPEEIAKDAAIQIVDLFDKLVEKQNVEKCKKEENQQVLEGR